MGTDRVATGQWFAEHGITEVECLIPDLAGNARGKFIPLQQFLELGDVRLPEATLIQGITGEYSDSHWDFVEPTDTDTLLRPDYSSLRLVPWASKPTAQLVHDCYTMEGQLHPLATRSLLRRVLDRYRELGLQPVVAPEVEFYLVARNTDFSRELQAPIGRSGRAESSRMSFSIDAMAEFAGFIDQLYGYAQVQQLDVDTLVHENGAAQIEVNFRHGDALSLADQVFALKRAVREAAHRHGIYATFMAKPLQAEPGSALHIHQSLVDVATGENIFAAGEGGHSPALRSYIAGLQHYTPQLISFYFPNVNSYRRLAPGIAAPVSMDWGYDNRTVAFRVPASTESATRVENRFPGADANPYLAIAASLGSGYLGMKQQLQASEPHLGTVDDSVIGVPRSLEEGLRDLSASLEIRELFGERFLAAYAAVKTQEFEAFNQVVTPWEREHLLLQV